MKKFTQFIQSNNSLKSHYIKNLELYREDAKSSDGNDLLSEKFQSFYESAIFECELDKYTSLNFYWFNLIEALIEIISYHSEFEIGEEFEMSESEDAIFNFWHDSNLAKVFLNNLSESKNLLLESKKLVSILEENIISFFKLHIKTDLNKELIYLSVPELGDDANSTFLPIGKRLSFKSIEDKVLATIDPGRETEIATTSKIENLNVIFYQELASSKDTITKKVTKAHNRLKTLCPNLFTIFNEFTHTIIPINEKGIVSYSMQSLPGYSSINIYDRDDIDLMDDLLHENGHHILNSYLNQEDLLEELEEKIYYSPWRRALRPIRGIYHAYMTFYWALELFSSLAQSATNEFSSEELKKIQLRAIEEYYMLRFCESDLEKAYKEEIISPEGNKIYLQFKSLIDGHRDFVISLEKKLKHHDIESLKNNLVEARNKYY